MTAQEGLNLLDVRITVRSDDLDRTGAPLDVLLPPRGEYRDDLIGQLRDTGHEVKHGITSHLDRDGAAHRAHREKVVAPTQKGEFSAELAGTENGVAHPLAGKQVEHLDLAFDDIQKMIHRVAEPGDHVAGGVRPLASDGTDGLDVRGCERNRFHLR